MTSILVSKPRITISLRNHYIYLLYIYLMTSLPFRTILQNDNRSVVCGTLIFCLSSLRRFFFIVLLSHTFLAYYALVIIHNVNNEHFHALEYYLRLSDDVGNVLGHTQIHTHVIHATSNR